MALERSPTDSAGYDCNGSDIDGLEEKDEDNMSLDGMSCDSDSLAIQPQPGQQHDDQRAQSPDDGIHQQSSSSSDKGRIKGNNYDADSSRPSVIETANKASHIIECT